MITQFTENKNADNKMLKLIHNKEKCKLKH